MIEQLNLIAPDAVRIQKMPTEPIVREAEIEGDFRWSLKRAWGAGPCILWCGLNPSTANHLRDDPTMKREMGFSFRWGFGSLIKINLYPYRTSSPVTLESWRKHMMERDDARLAFYENAQRAAAHVKQCSEFVAAWGAHAIEKDLQKFSEIVTHFVDGSEDGLAAQVPVQWKCLAVTSDGSPRHTLARGRQRIPDDAVLKPWKPKFNRVNE